MLTKYFKPHIGGVERHVEYLSKELIKRGHKVTIITENVDNKLLDFELISNIKVKRFVYPHLKVFGLLVVWYRMILLIKNILNADLVHVHDVYIWYIPFRIIFPFKPTYMTFHGYEGYPVKSYIKTLRKLYERLANGNICIGDFMKKWYGTNTNIILYGAVSGEYLKKYSTNRNLYDAVFSGRLDAQASVKTYFDAIDLLGKGKLKFNVVVLGSGDYQMRKQNNLILKGEVKNPLRYYRCSKCAFVSRYLAILEAFATRKMVFAVYDNPLKEDYLKQTPFCKYVVLSSTPDELREKVLYYFKERNKADAIVDKAFNWVKKRTWEELTNRYINLWEGKLN